MEPIKKNKKKEKKTKEKNKREAQLNEEKEKDKNIIYEKKKIKRKINSDSASGSDSNQNSFEITDKNENKNKIKLIDSKKLYKYEPKEKFKKDKSPFKGNKIFSTDKKENKDKNNEINKITNENESNSNSDSKNKNDSSSSSEEEEEQKEEKIQKRKDSSSSNSSSSSSSSSNPPPHPESHFKNKTDDLASTIIRERIEKIIIRNKNIPTSKNADNKFLKDKKENEVNIKNLLDNISKNIKTCKGKLEQEMEEIYSHKDFFEKNNFILTDLSCKRMAQIIHYIKSGNPVLLEGDTGTAKTRTSVIACEYLMEFGDKFKDKKGKEENKIDKKEVNYIKFNLSAETKIDNLMDKYVGDSKSVCGIKIEKGAFYKAFEEGKILILDEINLAPKEVLDCIGQSLDNKILSTELTGKELKCHPVHPNFALIATQNPLKGSFSNKRQNLGYAFFSRFQKVNCEKFNEAELLKIAKGLSKKEKIDIDEEILKNIINFHMEWEKEASKSTEDIFCFTIREIETVLNALKDNTNSPYSILMNIYGARYPKKEKEKMEKILEKEKYSNLKLKVKEK